MNAITMLIQDHEEVVRLLEHFDEAEADEQAVLAARICRLLTVHSQVEEELFYPAARQALGPLGERLLDDAAVEHATDRELVSRLQSSGEGYALFAATVRVMGEYFRHHLRQEETLLFPRVQNTELDLEALGERMGKRKRTLLSAADSRLVAEEDEDDDLEEELEDDEEVEDEDDIDEDDIDEDEDEDDEDDEEDEEDDEAEEAERTTQRRRPAGGRSPRLLRLARR
ncbi:MAG TPA: hemerythrin domain-containing protein [Steroidobacteraceae bacterium]|nr:hemerythrin domain-containing protein [Steroidobacteraceae bacterium]